MDINNIEYYRFGKDIKQSVVLIFITIDINFYILIRGQKLLIPILFTGFRKN